MRIALACLVLGACTTPPSEPDPLVPPAVPLPVWTMATDGVFFPWTELTLHGQLLPDANGTAPTLRAYAEAPGTTLLALADAAELPVLATLRAQLPPAAAAQLDRWFDEAIGMNVLGRLAILGIAETLELTPYRVVVESELAIDGRIVTHRPTAIYFEPDTLEERHAIAIDADAIAQLQTTATITPTPHGGRLDLAPRGFDVPLGELRWRNLDDRSDLRATIGGLTGCPLVAATVAGACGATCLGQLDELATLCERGLDLVLAQTHQEQAAIRLRLAGGVITPLDRDGDEIADELAGRWTAELDPGAGGDPTPVTATFSARRSLVH